ncbi:MAG TPA: winged helix-turn-helix domain-containing protein [Allosphingosinicella sp.]|nr:winged helix-turn-helix domain-containing protein [Allosphingosinicella sp.]
MDARTEDFAEAGCDPVAIGACLFDPRRGVIRRGAEECRLEHRTALTLALLCRRRGELVTREEIRRAIWNGRITSPNSLAIVIGDIRRALGDDARDPAFIETVAKRGYRLKPEAPSVETAVDRPGARAGRGRRTALAAAAAFVIVAAFYAAFSWWPRPASLWIEPVRNMTGDARYAATASALGALETAKLSGDVGLSMRAGVAPAADGGLTMRSTLILWDGHPSLSMILLDGKRRILWSGMASGPPFYASVSRQLERLAGLLRTRAGEGHRLS